MTADTQKTLFSSMEDSLFYWDPLHFQEFKKQYLATQKKSSADVLQRFQDIQVLRMSFDHILFVLQSEKLNSTLLYSLLGNMILSIHQEAGRQGLSTQYLGHSLLISAIKHKNLSTAQWILTHLSFDLNAVQHFSMHSRSATHGLTQLSIFHHTPEILALMVQYGLNPLSVKGPIHYGNPKKIPDLFKQQWTIHWNNSPDGYSTNLYNYVLPKYNKVETAVRERMNGYTREHVIVDLYLNPYQTVVMSSSHQKYCESILQALHMVVTPKEKQKILEWRMRNQMDISGISDWIDFSVRSKTFEYAFIESLYPTSTWFSNSIDADSSTNLELHTKALTLWGIEENIHPFDLWVQYHINLDAITKNEVRDFHSLHQTQNYLKQIINYYSTAEWNDYTAGMLAVQKISEKIKIASLPHESFDGIQAFLKNITYSIQRMQQCFPITSEQETSYRHQTKTVFSQFITQHKKNYTESEILQLQVLISTLTSSIFTKDGASPLMAERKKIRL